MEHTIFAYSTQNNIFIFTHICLRNVGNFYIIGELWLNPRDFNALMVLLYFMLLR